jgi:hypothetical protein
MRRDKSILSSDDIRKERDYVFCELQYIYIILLQQKINQCEQYAQYQNHGS